ncbi:MAG: DoxX family protein [Dysgonamonadaceae bacterium]|jgi:uncharacterized membrane protein YphA (DoxX/SURF4 family)|nr:DoxX family protein [Dysgonamonadaceae bacterium]
MKTKNVPFGKYQKIAVEICRILIALVFVFSGFVKAVDPWGSAYKFQDYFAVWNFTFLDFLALPASFSLATLEFTLGVCLLVGIYRKIASRLTFLFMCFMTPLTLYLAIFNPVTDCGCFGDALVITNWQTFYKNIVLIIAAFIVVLRHKQITCLYSRKYRSRVLTVTLVFILGISIYCFRYLPILDFRPYKIGNHVPELMQIPEGATADVYETTLIYEKNGVRKNFTVKNYPKEDSGWVFVETIHKLIKKGYEPPVHDFSITTEAGDDITDEVLADDGYTFLLISHRLGKADDSNVGNINSVYDYALQNNYRFLCLTASLPREITEWKENSGAEYPFCTMDGITLKTIIRSNPGLLLIKDGTVVNKWPNRLIPGSDDWQAPLKDSPLGFSPANQDLRNLLLLSSALIIPLIIIGLIDRKRKKRRMDKCVATN